MDKKDKERICIDLYIDLKWILKWFIQELTALSFNFIM